MSKVSREYMEEALRLAKDRLPGWAWAKIHQAARSKAGGKIQHVEGFTRGEWEADEGVRQSALAHLTSSSLEPISDKRLSQIWKTLGGWFSSYKRLKKSTSEIINAASAVLSEMEKREISVESDQLTKAISSLDIRKSDGALVEFIKEGIQGINSGSKFVFVVSRPNEIEKARGEFLTGPDGLTFKEKYLSPLGVSKDDCSVIDISRIHLLRLFKNAVVVSLGKDAKRCLGSLADNNLPHPNAVRRFGSSGEVERKIKQILKDSPDYTEDTAHQVHPPRGGFALKNGRFTLVGRGEDCEGPSLSVFKVSSSELPSSDSGSFDSLEVSEDGVQLFLDGNTCKGKYLFYRDNEVGNKIWAIKGLSNSYEDFISASEEAIETFSRNKSEKEDSQVREVPILKADSEKQIVYGIVLDPYQVDAHKDWIPPKAIEDTAHNWMMKSGIIGFNHQEKADAKAVESWIVPYPSSGDYEKAMLGEDHKAYTLPFGNDVVHSGSWVLGTKLSDKEWELVQSGELNAYSIGGFGSRTDVTAGEMPEVTFIDLSKVGI